MSENVVAALVTAVGVVLAALIARSDRRADTRYEDLAKKLGDVEKSQGTLAAAIERLERRMEDGLARLADRMEDGLARLADRIDRLYGSAPAGPATTTTPAASEDEQAYRDDLRDWVRNLAAHGAIPPDPGPRSTISAAELNAQVEALRRAVEAYSEQQQERGAPGPHDAPTEEGHES